MAEESAGRKTPGHPGHGHDMVLFGTRWSSHLPIRNARGRTLGDVAPGWSPQYLLAALIVILDTGTHRAASLSVAPD